MTRAEGLAERLARLEAKQQVGELLARYARMVDAADLDALRELFDPQIAWISPGRVELEGIDAVAAYYADWYASPYRDTRHHISNVTIVVSDDAAEATAESYYLELASYEELSVVGYGNYRDVFRKDEQGRWRIVFRKHSGRKGQCLGIRVCLCQLQ